MAVGRTRKANKHLPRRMYQIHGAYWFVPPRGPWVRLGADYGEALKRYGSLVDAPALQDRVDALIDRYEAEVLPLRAAVTARGRRQEFKRVRRSFGHMDPKALQACHAWEYFTAAGGTQQARHEIRALSAVMGWAVRWGAIPVNPLLRIGFPTAKPRTRYVKDNEFVAVHSVASPMMQRAMNIALITAMRQQDLRNLKRSDIKDGVLAMTATKTGKVLTLPVVGELEDEIRLALKLGPDIRQHIICNRWGKPYSLGGFQTVWKRAVQKALKLRLIDQPFTFHDLRRKSLSDAASLEEARQRAQHSDSRLTARVYRVLPEMGTVMKIGHLKAKG